MSPRKIDDPPSPRYDSNGNVVPIWEAIEVEILDDEKPSLKEQFSWKSWISKTTSWGSIRGESFSMSRHSWYLE